MEIFPGYHQEKRVIGLFIRLRKLLQTKVLTIPAQGLRAKEMLSLLLQGRDIRVDRQLTAKLIHI